MADVLQIMRHSPKPPPQSAPVLQCAGGFETPSGLLHHNFNSPIHNSRSASRHGKCKPNAEILVTKSAPPSRKGLFRSAPNLLKQSMLKKAVEKETVISEDSPQVLYTSPGHHCWSSLKAREWQEFQRLVNDENFTNGGTLSHNSYMYFNSSPTMQAFSRASKRTVRRQMASPDSDFYNKERAKDFAVIEQAIQLINFRRDQKRQDYLSGVPQTFLDKITSKDDSDKDVKPKESEDVENKQINLRFQTPPKSDEDGQAKKPVKSTSKYSLPRFYVFPKSSDFVPAHGTKLKPIGVKWKFSNCHNLERSQSAQVANGKLLKTCKPVTDGLNKHGTSVSKIKGKALHKGEWNIHKVWNQKIDEQSLNNALQMSRNNTAGNLNFNGSLMKPKKEQTFLTREDAEEEDDTLSMDAQSIEPDDSNEDGDELDHSIFSD